MKHTLSFTLGTKRSNILWCTMRIAGRWHFGAGWHTAASGGWPGGHQMVPTSLLDFLPHAPSLAQPCCLWRPVSLLTSNLKVLWKYIWPVDSQVGHLSSSSATYRHPHSRCTLLISRPKSTLPNSQFQESVTITRFWVWQNPTRSFSAAIFVISIFCDVVHISIIIITMSGLGGSGGGNTAGSLPLRISRDGHGGAVQVLCPA